jgi:hypothetical protein
MSPKLVYTAAAVAAALSLTVAPADAQDRRGGGRVRARAEQSGGEKRQDSGRRAVPRPAASQQAAAVRQTPRYQESRQAAAPQQAPQFSQGRRDQAPQDGVRSNQARVNSASQYNSGGSPAQRYSGSQTMPRAAGYGEQGQRAASRGYGSSGGYQSPANRYDDRRGYARPGSGYGRYETRGYVRPPHFQPYRPLYFSRPYYGFRPHVHIGFGVWLGVTVPYPWAYFGSYMPRVYGYYSRGYYGVAPGGRAYGGLSFDIQPSDADLYVDGEYVGPVGTFTPYGEPLTLWPGVHHIAIVREGFRTMEWEVTVEPGRVIPYRGMLARW